MNWILIGTLLGSTITSSHDTEEACRGRLAMLQKKEVIGQCISPLYYSTGTLQLCTTCNNTTITIPRWEVPK